MSDDRRILLLRGVNVGANRKLPMAELRAILECLGLTQVTTHIQSGNAVFRDPLERGDLATEIADTIAAGFPFRPDAMLLSVADFRAVLDANPWARAAREEGAVVHTGFLGAGVEDVAAVRERLDALKTGAEEWALEGRALYLLLPDGVGRSRLASGAERALKVPLTIRNQRVCDAIADLAQEL